MKYLAGLVALWTCAVASLTPVAGALPEVRTDKGRVTGVGGRNAAVRVFKGIPFAAPPVGLFRWRAPQPVACSLGGVRVNRRAKRNH
jgi:para-nitrobenzyl esterase